MTMSAQDGILLWCKEFVLNLADDIVDCEHESRRVLRLLSAPGALASEPIREVFPLAAENGIRVEIPEQQSNLDISEGGKVKDNYGQLKVIRQVANSSCGYYTLFNSIQILLTAHLHDPVEANRSLKLLHSRSYFWCHFMRWYQMLEDKVELESYHDGVQVRFKYPWTKIDVGTGVLERFSESLARMSLTGQVSIANDPSYRPYMLYLLSEDPYVAALSKITHFESVPEMSRNSLRMNGLPMFTLQVLHRCIERLRKNDSIGCSQAFAVGQTNHWISIVVLKHNDGVVETMVLDSRNNFTLGKTSEQLHSMAQHRMRKFKEEGTWADMRRRLYLQSLEDTQFSSTLLHDATTGRIDIARTIITFNIESFFESYSRATGDRFFLHDGERPTKTPQEMLQNNMLPEEPTLDGWLAMLIAWLENISPPPVLESSFCNNILRLIDLGFGIPDHLVVGLRRWVLSVEGKLRHVSMSSKILERFVGTLKRFHEVLDCVEENPVPAKY